MRFKIDLRHITLLVVAGYILHLAITNQLQLYIHPRYIILTSVLSAICVLILLLNPRIETQRFTLKKQLSTIPLVVVIIAALVLPVRSLTSATVSQRSIDTVSTRSLSNKQQVSALFRGSTTSFELADWARLLEINSDPDYYAKKPVRVSGFVYNSKESDDVILLSRFILTCCAVDAQPISVPVFTEQWDIEYQEDEWLEIKGVFESRTMNGERQLLLIPEEIIQIEEPENPYAN